MKKLILLLLLKIEASASIVNSNHIQPIFVPKHGDIALIKNKGTSKIGISANGYVDDKDVIIYGRIKYKSKTPLSLYLKHYKRFKAVESHIDIASHEYAVPKWFLSTLLYNESKFNNNAKSWTGVRGIAQITRATRKRFGIGKSTEDQIRGMAKIIRYELNNLPDYYTEEEKLEISAIIYSRGKNYYFKVKRAIINRGDHPSLALILKEFKRYKYMREGLEYVKRLNENKYMFGE